jgi:hypothetical protein
VLTLSRCRCRHGAGKALDELLEQFGLLTLKPVADVGAQVRFIS